MPTARKSPAPQPTPASAFTVQQALSELKQRASPAYRAGLARYGIPDEHALGVAVRDIQALGKRIGRQHALAPGLWDSGIYEARLLVAFVADPARLSAAQMEAWCKEFDSWAVCDTLCMHLFDRTPHAWAKVKQWSGKRGEFVRRAAFALLASLAGHDKQAGDAAFRESLKLIETAACDERNFVKKGVSWALRGIGHRNAALHAKALALARKLAASEEATERWVGKDALRDLSRPLVLKKVARKD